MSDVEDAAGPTPVRVKEVGTTMVACPMLSSTNYTVWALRMKVVLRIHKVWLTIEPGTVANEEKNNLAMGLMYQAIPETLIMQIGDVDSPKVLWESIKARYVGADRVKEARLQTLNSEFDRLKMHETETIDVFAGKLAGIASKSASLGETIDESKLVKKLLKVVPRKFIHLVASLEQVLDLKTVGFEDVVGRLKAYEERVRGEDGVDEQRVLFTRGGGRNAGGGGRSGDGSGCSGSSKEMRGKREMRVKWGKANNRSKDFINQDGYGSDGSGSSSGSDSSSGSKAQSIIKPNKSKQNSDSNRNQKKNLSKIKCYRCDKSGHYSSKCPDRLQKFQESNFMEQEDIDETVFLHEIIGSNQVQGNAELDRNQRHL